MVLLSSEASLEASPSEVENGKEEKETEEAYKFEKSGFVRKCAAEVFLPPTLRRLVGRGSCSLSRRKGHR